ncbi:MAG: hypothetical protein ACKVOI_07575 [Dongiaceae bacterium]
MASDISGIWALISGIEKAPDVPGLQQTGQSIEAWIRKNIRIDAVVIVRHAQRNMVEFSLDRVISINFHTDRLTLENHGIFRFDGAGISGRKNAMTMLAPEADVIGAALSGQAWINGRPGYRRPLPSAELELANRLAGTGPEVPAVA